MRASWLVVNREERRLCVFFSAGATRYALDAVRVLEVARTSVLGVLKVSEELPIRDLSLLLGGEAEGTRGAAVVIDTSPRLAVGVKEVEGVFDIAGVQRWSIHGRLIPLLSPAIVGALEYENRLVFELDADGAARGLPKQMKPLERHLRSAQSGLVFSLLGERLAIPLHHVVQVVETGAFFNRSPNAGSFLGAVIHRAQLCPVFTVGPMGRVEPFLVLFEVGGDLFGLCASQVEGVRSGAALESSAILDVGRMFS